jgi:phytol kinase
MNNDIINTAILAISFLALFGLAEILFHYLKIRAEFTRKIVHVGTGLLTLLFPIMLANHWLVLLLCTSFAIILIGSLKFNLLKSINAIERESVGSIAYPVSVYGCYLAFDYFDQQYMYFYLPILILAICDPLAALTGKTWPMGKFSVGQDNKTLMGSSMFFFSAVIIISIFFWITEAGLTSGTILFKITLIALIPALAEALSGKGYDNLTIPAAVLLSMITINFIF